MRFSRNWIAAHVDIGEDAALKEVLSMLGLVVDGVAARGDDAIFDLDIASNRPDLMNHLAIAREIALAQSLPLRGVTAASAGAAADTATVASVQIAAPEGCSRFVAQAVLDVTVAPSPRWLVERLESVGLRPINNIVDVTNFVMWERGRPMHAYDLDKLAGAKLVVRRARPGERLVTLDEVDRELAATDLVIADAERPVGLAGVMGGAHTGVTESTRRVLLECACFDPAIVRATARRHGLHTDASHRFERGLAPAGLSGATARAAALAGELAGGSLARAPLDVRGNDVERPRVLLDEARVAGLLGIAIDPVRLRDMLRGLGFEIVADIDGRLDLLAPPQRTDIRLSEDVVEEVARFWGYARLPATMPVLRRADRTGIAPELCRERQLRHLLSGLGFWESMTFAFGNDEEQRRFLGDERTVPLLNPLSDALGVLRATMLPGLAAAVGRNLDRGAERVRLFEVGRTFNATDGVPDERRRVALVACGPVHAARFAEPARAVDFADLRGAVDVLACRMRWPLPEWSAAEVPGFETGASAVVNIGGCRGRAGRIDAELAARTGVERALWAAELDVEELLHRAAPPQRLRPPARFPSSSRDLSLLVPRAVVYGQLERAVRDSAGVRLESVVLIDVYRGNDPPDGDVSMTIRLTFRADDRTLTAEEVEADTATVADRLATDHAVRRR